MPNWVRTRTRIEGPEEQIAKVRAMAEIAKKTDAGFFDQFAPIPEGLDDIQVFGDVNDLQKATDDADLFRRFGKQVMKHIDRLEEALQAGAECSFDGFWKSLANLSLACRFKQETGRSYVQYLTDVRMEHAVELLRTTDDKTYMVAEKVGYDEPNYFSYVFKRRFGVSPSQFRK